MRGSANVTVHVAVAQGPSIWPVSALSPEGISTATMGHLARVRASISSAYMPRAGPRMPVPNSASTAMSALASAFCTVAMRSTDCTMSGGSRSKLVFASPVISWADVAVNTWTLAPLWAACLATTKPSPPLLPLPHRMTMCRFWSSPSRFSTTRVTPCPAASMSSMPGTPLFIARRSIEAIWEPVMSAVIMGGCEVKCAV